MASYSQGRALKRDGWVILLNGRILQNRFRLHGIAERWGIPHDFVPWGEICGLDVMRLRLGTLPFVIERDG